MWSGASPAPGCPPSGNADGTAGPPPLNLPRLGSGEVGNIFEDLTQAPASGGLPGPPPIAQLFRPSDSDSDSDPARYCPLYSEPLTGRAGTPERGHIGSRAGFPGRRNAVHWVDINRAADMQECDITANDEMVMEEYSHTTTYQ